MVDQARVLADRAWLRIRRRPVQAIVALLVVAGGLTTAFISPSNADNSCGTGFGYGYSSNGSFGYGYGQCPTPPPPPPTSAFVIGDVSAGSPTVGRVVNFWGAQWAKNNAFSGGGAPPSMKGFANQLLPSLTCNSAWMTRPGNSSRPPLSLPSTIEVIVTAKAGKFGPAIMGGISHIVVVQVKAGYGPDPGHPGFGTIVRTVC